MTEFMFWFFAVMTVGSAVAVVAQRNAINSAMSLVATFFFLAGLYVLLWAHTIAVIQVLVYAGAIMVLFLFVIMLLSVTHTGADISFNFSRVVGGLASILLLAVLLVAIVKLSPAQGVTNNVDAMRAFGSIQSLGIALYTQWLSPFEAVSLLLLVAIVGAVVVAKSRI